MKPYKHQQELLELDPKRWALIWGMGTGKTLGALFLATKNCQNIMVICPKGLKGNWEKVISNFKNNILIITKETFKRDYLKLPKYECVIVDECHYFLGTKSAQMKSLRHYFKLHNTKYRYFLTGTPYRSSPMDIYVLSNLMGRPLDYWRFFNQFFYNVPMGRRMVPMVRANIEQSVAEIVKSLGNTIKLEECVDMPPQTFKEEYFELTTEQKQAINEIQDTQPIVKYTKVHQICGGTLKGDEYTPDKIVKCHKTERLLEIMDEVERLVVVCRYNNEIAHLLSLAKQKYPARHIEFINGSVDNRQAILDKMESEKSYVLIVNSACSEGWQLQNCCHMVFYSYDFQLKNKLQMEARLTRIDKPRPTFYLSLLTKGTIDEAIYKT